LPKIVTTRNNEEVKYVHKICEKENLGIEIFNSDYNSKANFCKGSFAHLDDSLYDLDSLEGIVENLVLFNKPHNMQVNPNKGIKRVNSWKEFYSFLRTNK